jgi:hypothetical protein
MEKNCYFSIFFSAGGGSGDFDGFPRDLFYIMEESEWENLYSVPYGFKHYMHG